MGLAGAKSKRKLAKDPNNTKWSRNTDSFGHKILRSQGWQPGQYLGAENAPHAEFHTAANASHVRAVLTEGNLGIGARRNQGDECTGLDAFQMLLGRLNGKSEDAIKTERRHRSDVKLHMYIEQRFGTIRFVRGGLLVGDKLKTEGGEDGDDDDDDDDSVKKEEDDAAGLLTSCESSEEITDKPRRERKGEKKTSKKRRAAEQDDEADLLVDSDARRKEKKRRRKGRRSKDLGDEGSTPDDNKTPEDSEMTEGDKKSNSKERKSKKGRASREEEADSSSGEQDERPKRKDKEKKKKKKRRAEKEGEASATANGDDSSGLASAVISPSNSGTSTPQALMSRHLARKRFITQKRMATLDPQALNQIFMIKS